MKSCPKCCRLYADDAGFCPIDGEALRSATDVPPAPSDDDKRLGTILHDRYQVRRVVADGGMGRVYETLDNQTNRRVALKVLHAEVARDKVALERFKREFEISKLLPHEYIVEVFDFFKLPDGSHGIAMDFLEGEELRALLKREKTLPTERLVRMLSQLAIGLDEAHQRQLIHRDLKPDNIFLCGTHEGDIVKLLDFGSVKDKSEGAKKLTVMGTTIGSPYYMSPEQAQGLESLDARADVWALAAITYEAVCGEVPFPGTSGPAILLSILTHNPKPASLVASTNGVKHPVPPTLDDVLNDAFAKNPAERIATIGLLANKIGEACGLDGNHREWACIPTESLHERIAAVMPSLLAKKKSVAVALETDPFAAPRPASANAPLRLAHSPGSVNEAELAAVIPKTPSKLLIILASSLVLGALTLAVVLYLIFR